MSGLERWPWLSHQADVHSGDTVFAGTRVPLARLRDYRRGRQSVVQFMTDFPTVPREHVEAAWAMSDAELDTAIDIAPAINAWVAEVNRTYEAMQVPGFVERGLDGLKPPLTARIDSSEADLGQDERRDVVWCVEEPVGPPSWDRWSTYAICWTREGAERIAAGIEGSRVKDWLMR